MMSMNLNNIAILNIKGSDYCCINNGMSKNEAINVMQITDLTKKNEKLQTIHLLSYIKMVHKNLTFGDIEIQRNKFYCHEKRCRY